MSAFFNEIDRLSPRELQRYASACLQAYCNAKLIQPPSIDALSIILAVPARNGMDKIADVFDTFREKTGVQ
ncbi:hypothetical protein SOASR015_12720 [Pectobacterium carotovorum subsp. carotovorum]|nr:hypothetical protein SOASR015_12720 [Pectobacterium carotovorum subsp. carotovorum]GLX55583.1 hypothetical protein Pcaca02_08920 [Pectobacterium carotovorum subsp. carotovorum]